MWTFLKKFILSLVVWLVVAIIVWLLGGLVNTVDNTTAHNLGQFLKDSSGLVGFLFGVWYFFWGPDLPTATRV